MFWEEDKDENTPYTVPEDVLDLVYHIRCKCLPLDHAHALTSAVRKALPWIDEEPLAGIHLIHGAESGNGWVRPEETDSNALLHLSGRSRMTLRIPGSRVEDATRLTGTVLDIEGHRLEIGKVNTRLFSTLPTQFARYVVVPDGMDHEDEEAFMRYVAEQLQSLEVPVRKLLCGLTHAIRYPDGDLYTRSVMLADLEPEQAIRLQQSGIGPHRKMGCGLFLPHKGIRAVHEMTVDKK